MVSSITPSSSAMRASNWASEWRIAGCTSPLTTPGAEVTVYYRVRDPRRWALTAPYRMTRWLFWTGAVLTVVGLLLPVLLG